MKLDRKSLTFSLLISAISLCVLADEAVKPEPTDMPNQHIVVLSLSAKFHCGLDRWPADLDELRSFQDVNDISLGVESVWNWILSDDFEYVFTSEKMDLISISLGEDGKITTVKSGQTLPLCKDGATEIRGASIDVDFGDEDS